AVPPSWWAASWRIALRASAALGASYGSQSAGVESRTSSLMIPLNRLVVIFLGQLHDLVREAALAEQARHGLHRRSDVSKEGLVAGAQVVEPVLAVGCLDEAVARALTVAGEQNRAFLAELRQRVVLALAEAELLLGRDQRLQRRVLDVAEQVIWLDVVIAGVHIAVVLHRQGPATRGRDDAGVVLPQPTAERHVEGDDIHFADIALHPFVVDADEELAELFRRHRALGDQVALLLVQRPVRTLQAAPALVGEGYRLLGSALDDGDQLDVLRLQLVAKEAVHGERVVGVGGVNRAEDVDVDVVRAQAVPAADHVVEAAFALLVDAVRVVQLARPIDAQADQVVVLLEESGPLVVDERAVGLHRVQDAPMVRLAVLVGQRDRTLVEVQSAQHWLA